MAIRSSKNIQLYVELPQDVLLEYCVQALSQAGYKNAKVFKNIFSVNADYSNFVTLVGKLEIQILPDINNGCMIHITSTANSDNIYALFRSPNTKLIEKFASQLDLLVQQ